MLLEKVISSALLRVMQCARSGRSRIWPHLEPLQGLGASGLGAGSGLKSSVAPEWLIMSCLTLLTAGFMSNREEMGTTFGIYASLDGVRSVSAVL